MEVKTVTVAVESFSYAVEKSVWAGDERMVLRKISLQLNFVCEVAGGEFGVNPDEHSEGVWASREEVGGLEMTGEMRVVVENAFRWK